MYKSENEVKTILQNMIDPFHKNIDIRVGKRSQGQSTQIREVTFFVLIPIAVDVSPIIKELNTLPALHNREIYFSGSETGMLHGDDLHDWLFITAEIGA